MSLVGIVVVSHSRELAAAARELALEMVPESGLKIELAAGTADGGFGTDAVAVSEAIAAADQGAGVLVFTDLGSAILSAEMALEFLPDPSVAQIVAAPFVEGLLAAAVRAAVGASLHEVAEQARSALQPKIEQLQEGSAQDLPEQQDSAPVVRSSYDAELEVQLVNPAGLHARPAAQIAVFMAQNYPAADVTIKTLDGKKSADARSALDTMSLGTSGGDRVLLCAGGEQAQAALAALAELIKAGFGEIPEGAAAAPSAHAEPARAASGVSQNLAGIKDAAALGVSSGRVVGTAKRIAPALNQPQQRSVPASDIDEQRQNLTAAIAAVTESLKARAEWLLSRGEKSSATAAQVLSATAALAQDPLITKRASELIGGGVAAECAVWQVLTDIERQYRDAGGVLAERASDVCDLRARLVAQLTGAELPGIPESADPFILVAHDLAPADAALLDPSTCLGMVLAAGGLTSHTAIIARSLGIPAVISESHYALIADGAEVLLDGGSGEIVTSPSAELAATAAREPVLLAELPPYAGGGKLLSGESVEILANIGGADDISYGVSRGAMGAGLFRTEFCFLGRDTAPTLAEQVAIYSKVFTAAAGRKVVVRTLDAGSDKPLLFVTAIDEPNPALGVRGYRTARKHPEVLATQLAAISQAAADVGAQPWVMAPMIATEQEAADFAELARSHGIKNVGVMVETPAAALLTEQIFRHVDFVSIGTNDLAQYTMAADRMLTELAALTSFWQPALLRMIGIIGSGAGSCPVGVCGEAAGDPLLAAVLVGLGVNSVSMNPNSVPLVGRRLAGLSLDVCRRAAAAACAAADERAAQRAAAEIIGAA